ncbi:MAG: hypothetical protein U5S82_14465 [Gammaproteobacteria bacterium]|nr:hypothetical protein [Gammaproteobacteria bacterium]
MAYENNRLLLELEKIRRDVNREVINPEIPELSMADIEPIIRMVAKVRLAYLKEFLDIARMDGDMPSSHQVEMLKGLRHAYEELVAAANAMETAIQRGYVDVRGVSG